MVANGLGVDLDGRNNYSFLKILFILFATMSHYIALFGLKLSM